MLGLGQIVERTLARDLPVRRRCHTRRRSCAPRLPQLAASEAAHLTVLERLNGGSGLGAVLPKALDPEQASAALAPYWGAA